MTNKTSETIRKNETLEDNEIIDSLGRIIKLKEIKGKSRISFYRALGSKDSSNIGIIGEYWPVMAIESIDGEICMLKTMVDLDMTYNKLEKGNAFALVDAWLNRKSEEALLSEKEDIEQIKK